MTVRKDTKQHFKEKLWNNNTRSQQNIDTWTLKPSRFHLWVSPIAPSRFRFFANFQAQPQLAIITNTLGSLIVAPCRKSIGIGWEGKIYTGKLGKPMFFFKWKTSLGGFRWPFSNPLIWRGQMGWHYEIFFYRIEPQWKDDEVCDQWLMMVNSV